MFLPILATIEEAQENLIEAIEPVLEANREFSEKKFILALDLASGLDYSAKKKNRNG